MAPVIINFMIDIIHCRLNSFLCRLNICFFPSTWTQTSRSAYSALALLHLFPKTRHTNFRWSLKFVLEYWSRPAASYTSGGYSRRQKLHRGFQFRGCVDVWAFSFLTHSSYFFYFAPFPGNQFQAIQITLILQAKKNNFYRDFDTHKQQKCKNAHTMYLCDVFFFSRSRRIGILNFLVPSSRISLFSKFLVSRMWRKTAFSSFALIS